MSGDTLPVFAFVLFGITGLLLLATVAVPIVVCCHRSCFHRRMKFVSPCKCSVHCEWLSLRVMVWWLDGVVVLDASVTTISGHIAQYTMSD